MPDGKRKVLFVDDDPSMVKMYGKRFETAGYHVLTAGDGEEALATIAGERPDVVVLDIELPKLNGYEVCARVKQRQETKHIPVVMFTAKGQPQEHVAGLMLGADVYVSKSCQAKALLDQVERMLANRPAAG